MDVDVQSLQDRANWLEQELQAVRQELARSQQKSNESADQA
jgi:predicted ATP-grasp superfamily ATP-dependent carboligase